ncbi:MAG: hypothetical protein KA354_09240 [Phycisphaerae bacterium]|nr:hypothetical protein [Phycisphaerae bacterium]
MTMLNDLHWPACEVGLARDGSRIEWSGKMKALAYFGQGRFELIEDRPIVCTEHDLLARVERVYRCGTDVKICASGRPDQCEESLLDELRSIFAIDAPHRDGHFLDYSRLLLDNQPVGISDDRLFIAIRERLAGMSDEDRGRLSGLLRRFWGRILGHETVVTIERVGSKVHELREGIGYMAGKWLEPAYLAFKPGDRCVLQSRIARYDPPPTSRPNAAGIQLLGGNITDLAMNLAGAYAQYIRLTPPIIRSGSVIRVPGELPNALAAFAEPAACLLDCFQKSTHELGQDDHGSILHKSVLPGGTTCVIGSGAMAMMSMMFALVNDDVLGMSSAAQVVAVVRGDDKADLVRRIMADPRVVTVVCKDESQLPGRIAKVYGPQYQQRTGKSFHGFDDVIVAAGNAQTLSLAHALIAPTGARIMAFAGTRGPCELESGVWHYANAGLLGTSGSNTKMLELALELFNRSQMPVERLAGKGYTFNDFATPAGIRAFFEDKHLRPYLQPNTA